MKTIAKNNTMSKEEKYTDIVCVVTLIVVYFEYNERF